MRRRAAKDEFIVRIMGIEVSSRHAAAPHRLLLRRSGAHRPVARLGSRTFRAAPLGNGGPPGTRSRPVAAGGVTQPARLLRRDRRRARTGRRGDRSTRRGSSPATRCCRPGCGAAGSKRCAAGRFRRPGDRPLAPRRCHRGGPLPHGPGRGDHRPRCDLRGGALCALAVALVRAARRGPDRGDPAPPPLRWRRVNRHRL